jgi:uncharacterized heparinase superfamily protein
MRLRRNCWNDWALVDEPDADALPFVVDAAALDDVEAPTPIDCSAATISASRPSPLGDALEAASPALVVEFFDVLRSRTKDGSHCVRDPVPAIELTLMSIAPVDDCMDGRGRSRTAH